MASKKDLRRSLFPNDFYAETYLSLVHGTNSGGKTAFLRMIGICTIFALVGFYVPANEMTIPYIGCVYTAFAQDEAIHAGRLTNEQKRMEKILSETRAYDLVLVNEIYSSTNQKESAELSNEILKKFHENCSMSYGIPIRIMISMKKHFPYFYIRRKSLQLMKKHLKS